MLKIQGAPACFALVGLGFVVHAMVSSSSTASSPQRGPSEPTVVAFTATGGAPNPCGEGREWVLWRLWSDGTVESKFITRQSSCQPPWIEVGNWETVPGTAQGHACASDIDGNRVVDGTDLALVLGAWGGAPECAPLPPISCTLDQIPAH